MDMYVIRDVIWELFEYHSCSTSELQLWYE